MKTRTMTVKIGGKTVQVPVYVDEQTTLKCVEAVNARLREVEEDSAKIDTQAFALQTAYSFAVDLARQKEDASLNEAEMLQALNRIHRTLQEVLAELAEQ